MWDVLTGTLEEIRDETLLDAGRDLYGRRGSPDLGLWKPPASSPSKTTGRVAFVAQREPWRLAVVDVGDSDDPLAVLWQGGVTSLIRGDPAQAEVLGPQMSHGDWSLSRLLLPQVLEELIPTPWPDHLVVPGRVLEASCEEEGFLGAPEIVLGAERYEAEFDNVLGIFTSWSAYINQGKALQFRLCAYLPLWGRTDIT